MHVAIIHSLKGTVGPTEINLIKTSWAAHVEQNTKYDLSEDKQTEVKEKLVKNNWLHLIFYSENVNERCLQRS